MHHRTRNSELGTRSSGLGVPLGSAEHGGRVAGDLRDTLVVDPNPNGILPLQRANDAPVAAAKSVSNADSRSLLSKVAKTSVVVRPGVPRPVARPFLSSKQTSHHAAIESVSD